MKNKSWIYGLIAIIVIAVIIFLVMKFGQDKKIDEIVSDDSLVSSVGDITNADKIIIAADSDYRLFLNGVRIGMGKSNSQKADTYYVNLKDGDIVAVRGIDDAGVGGLLVEIVNDGESIGTSSEWKVLNITQADWNYAFSNYNDSAWAFATDYGEYGVEPWGNNISGMPLKTPAHWIWSSAQETDDDVYFRYKISGSTGSISAPLQVAIPQSQMTATATSQHTSYEASKAIDGNKNTMWHTEWEPTAVALPQSITLSLGNTYYVNKVIYTPRQDGNNNGIVTGYKIYGSTNGSTFNLIATGYNWAVNKTDKVAEFAATPISHLRFEVTGGDKNFASIAEMNVQYMSSGETPTPPPPVITIPNISTTAVSSITQTTAKSGGKIASNGGSAVLTSGIIWGTNSSNLTTDLYTKTIDGTASGSFISNITGLTANTTYYVRAYATNSIGTAYGNTVSFKTSSTTTTVALPKVTTVAVSSITNDSAKSGGTIVSNGNDTITASGIVWDIKSNPKVTLTTKTTDGWATGGPWTSSMTGLKKNTNYYVRAYATNSKGTAYGNSVKFKTTNTTISEPPAPQTYNLGTETLKKGSTGEPVKELQRFLNDKITAGLTKDGVFGTGTETKVKTWQGSNNLTPDGIVGTATKAVMLGQSSTASACVDTDNSHLITTAGGDYHTKGTTTGILNGVTTTKTDLYQNSPNYLTGRIFSYVTEYSCAQQGNNPYSTVLTGEIKSRIQECPLGCVDGACTKPSVLLCSEEDTNNQYFQGSETTGIELWSGSAPSNFYTTRQDMCTSGKLHEWKCVAGTNKMEREIVTCPSGYTCQNISDNQNQRNMFGKCVPN